MYSPDPIILERYASVLVNYALNSGQGVKRGEVAFLQVPESAKPMLLPLQSAVLKSGAHPLIQYLPDGLSRQFYEQASSEQISYFPARFLKGRVDESDHFLTIIAETDKHELEGIDPQKIMDRNSAFQKYINWRNKKESRGKFTWTLGLFVTPAMAKEAKLTEKECWQEIIKACYLDANDPIKEWQKAQTEISRIKNKLNKLNIDKLHIESDQTDLWITLGEHRQWLGGDGRNIPSFEVFVSPDWRFTQGNAYFNLPLYRYGNLIKNIKISFSKGLVVSASADLGNDVLNAMIATHNANKIGEFSLTDKRLSRISRFMAETLYDENFGGDYGNFHIALGAAYKESLDSDPSKPSKSDWNKLGFNDSVVHTDIVSTTNRIVSAVLPDGQTKEIYKDGVFKI